MQELFVVKKGTGFFVRPAQIAVPRGQSFRVVNLTSQPAKLFCPELRPDIVDLAVYDRGPEEKHCGNITVPDDAPVGFSPIAVFSAEARDFCLGESAPGIIISR